MKRWALCIVLMLSGCQSTPKATGPPNLVFILTDDQRMDAMGAYGNPWIRTPNMDRLAERGVRFTEAFVTQSLCAPSRATCITGRYGSANGIMDLGSSLRLGEESFAQHLTDAGYFTGFVGKWHLWDKPWRLGFQDVTMFNSNGKHYDRMVLADGQWRKIPEYIEDYVADRSIRFLRLAQRREQPFLLWIATQVPHVDHNWEWPVREETLALYDAAQMPLPTTLDAKLTDKPPYLPESANRKRAVEFGFDREATLREQYRRYFGAVTEMDAALGRVLDVLDEEEFRNTWIILLGDNGWLMGEHGLTNKVIPYEESIRVPLVVKGPGLKPRVEDAMALNLDVAPTLLDLAGLEIPSRMQGHSLVPVLRQRDRDWRDRYYYESPKATVGTWPVFALRTQDWKYIQTYHEVRKNELVFEELYHLADDPTESSNLAQDPAQADRVAAMSAELIAKRRAVLRGESP